MPILIATGKDYAHEVLLDEVDYAWAVAQGNWFVTHGKHDKRSSGYAVRSVRLDTGKWGLMWLHKEVLRRAKGEPPTCRHTIGDHRNGNRLDNTRLNLRWATHQMNARNVHGFVTKQMEIDFGTHY